VRTAVLVVTATLGLTLVGCGGSPAPAPAPGPPDPASVPTAPPAGAASDDEAGCAVSAADLSAATGLTFEFGRRERTHELETVPGVTADVCGFTIPDRPQAYGDLILLRIDVTEGAGAERVRTEWERSCKDNGGTATDSSAASGARTCAREGALPEGLVGDGDRVVNAYYVSADDSDAAELNASFDKVLAALR
jgi:hypothetical protein